MTTNNSRPRGRPRRFDPEAAVASAQALFHARGYDAVSVADVTDALGINPPSLYAAFGSKAGLYARVLDRWGETGAIPLGDILRPDRPVAEALAELLEQAARHYAADPAIDPAAAGCMVLEGTRCADPDAREKHRDELTPEQFALAEQFADDWDQKAFDPDYDTLPLEHFEAKVRAVFATPSFF
jgi:TetR/AcrR family transcriptional repressor for divergent bdcA